VPVDHARARTHAAAERQAAASAHFADRAVYDPGRPRVARGFLNHWLGKPEPEQSQVSAG
jgi:hypothetical protein